MRVVLDTNVLARAASGPPSPAAELLKLCLKSPQVLCVSPFLLSELSRVLRYERVRPLHGMSDEVVDQFLQDLQAASLTVELTADSEVTGVTSDPDDDPIVATAVAAAAEFLCTLDRHLRATCIPIPLSAGDPDASLDLQSVFATTYDRAGYDYAIHYDRSIEPPLDERRLELVKRSLSALQTGGKP